MRLDRWSTGFYFTWGKLCIGLVTYAGNWQLSFAWIDPEPR